MKPTTREKLRTISLWLIGVFFMMAGANHFLTPAPYLTMMPPWLPAHMALIQLSGIAEIAGGIGILLPSTRRASAFGLLALLIAIFPANVHVALHGWPGTDIPRWALWFRLPFQPLFMLWIAFAASLFPKRKLEVEV